LAHFCQKDQDKLFAVYVWQALIKQGGDVSKFADRFQ